MKTEYINIKFFINNKIGQNDYILISASEDVSNIMDGIYFSDNGVEMEEELEDGIYEATLVVKIESGFDYYYGVNEEELHLSLKDVKLIEKL